MHSTPSPEQTPSQPSGTDLLMNRTCINCRFNNAVSETQRYFFFTVHDAQQNILKGPH